ncbi:hypothetical protein Syun_023125 [Stephania yunnanensis]|uniref:Uncharacterized protein n=1 Tax=Stephania yunnanensis TaxID=152371 RepID=A0AAP0I3L6_9MAGN
MEHTTVLVDEMMSLGSNLMDVNVALIKEHMAGSVLEHTTVLVDEMMSLGSNLMDVNVALIKEHMVVRFSLEHTLQVLVDEMMSLGSNLMDVNVALIKVTNLMEIGVNVGSPMVLPQAYKRALGKIPGYLENNLEKMERGMTTASIRGFLIILQLIESEMEKKKVRVEEEGGLKKQVSIHIVSKYLWCLSCIQEFSDYRLKVNIKRPYVETRIYITYIFSPKSKSMVSLEMLLLCIKCKAYNCQPITYVCSPIGSHLYTRIATSLQKCAYLTYGYDMARCLQFLQ